MLKTFEGVVREGRIELLEPAEIPDGTNLLITLLDDESRFWFHASLPAMGAIWDNTEDDVYAQLLQESTSAPLVEPATYL